MLHHERQRPPPADYPADEWNIIEKRFHPEFLAQLETMMARRRTTGSSRQRPRINNRCGYFRNLSQVHQWPVAAKISSERV